MFRQTVLIVSLVALATCNATTWFAIGTRVDGDQNIHNQTSRSIATDLPTNHTVNMTFSGGENIFTYSRFDIEEDYNDVTVYGMENGFQISITYFNTTQLVVEATIYGFLLGEAPIDFVSEKITSKRFTMH